MDRSTGDPVHVVIAGGGFAASEAAVALRALAGGRVRLSVLSPGPYFFYRPAATLEVFGGAPPLTYDLPDLLSGLRADHHRSALGGVDPQVKSVQLGSGRLLSYD